MKKRLMVLAVIAGMIFAIGVPAFAEDVFAAPSQVNISQHIEELDEGSSEKLVANVSILFDDKTATQKPTVTFAKTGDSSAVSLPCSWKAAEGYSFTGNNIVPIAYDDQGNVVKDELTGIDHYQFDLDLYVGADKDSAGEYTLTVGYPLQQQIATLQLTVNESADYPVFVTESDLTFELGSTNARAIVLENYKTSEIKWGIDDAGAEALKALNLQFDEKNAKIDILDDSYANNGVDYGENGKATFIISATYPYKKPIE